MHGSPSEPSREAAKLDSTALQHSETLSHNCHVALVKVAELGWVGITNNTIVNRVARIPPLLNRYLSHSWKGFTVLIKRRRVAHDKNLGMSGHSEILLNSYSPGAICFDVEPFTRRRRRDACSPDHR